MWKRKKVSSKRIPVQPRVLVQGEELIGARAWRVLFGVVSLPLAVTAVAYFINHRYDGVQLWDIKVPKLLKNAHVGIANLQLQCWYGFHAAQAFVHAEQGELLA